MPGRVGPQPQGLVGVTVIKSAGLGPLFPASMTLGKLWSLLGLGFLIYKMGMMIVSTS